MVSPSAIRRNTAHMRSIAIPVTTSLLMSITLACFHCASQCLATPPLAKSPDPASVVFSSGVDGYAVYRIPSIVRVNARNGPARLLAFAEGRNSLNDNGENDLVIKSSIDSGVHWSALKLVCDMPTRSLNNPCAVVLRDGPHDGRVLLMFGAIDASASFGSVRATIPPMHEGSGRSAMSVSVLNVAPPSVESAVLRRAAP